MSGVVLRLCIVIPAYNEEKRIIRTLEDFRKTIMAKYKNDVDILIVSESTDKTNSIVKSYASRYRQIKLVGQGKRRGKGGAIIKGFEIASRSRKWDVIGFVDADSSMSGREIIKLLGRLNGDKSIDGVIASRYIDGSRITGDLKASRFIASRMYNIMVRLLFGFKYSDTQCGAKFFRNSALRDTLPKLSLNDMSIDLDLLYQMKLGRFNVVEVPITYSMIQEGTKLDLKRHIPQMFVDAIRYRIAN